MRLLKKTLGVCMIGFGIGAMLVLLLPAVGWMFGIGVLLFILGIIWLCKWKMGGLNMKIVVYKPGNFMKGVLRILFKVKKQENT